MNDIERIKSRLTIFDLLANDGFEVTKSGHFLAVWRNETSPSVNVDKEGQKFMDYGDRSYHGDVIDLYMLIHKCGKLEAIKGLLEMSPSNLAPCVMSDVRKNKKTLVVEGVVPIRANTGKGAALLSYAASRKINPKTVQRYCVQVNYYWLDNDNARHDNTLYYSIGFKNDGGGYELRNERFKSCTGARAITTLNAGCDEVVVIEGYFDFLTAAQELTDKLRRKTVIVLNGAEYASKIDVLDYRACYYYGDNDRSSGTGDRVAAVLKSKLNGGRFVDCRGLYAGYNDLNDWKNGKKQPEGG